MKHIKPSKEEEEGNEPDEQTRAQKREAFEQNLVEQGLELELEEAKASLDGIS